MASNDTPTEEILLPKIYKKAFMHRGVLFSAATNPEILHRCEQFEFRPDDIIVATYPRSGTTLTQEIVWQIVNHESVKKDEQYGQVCVRFPFLEYDMKYGNRPGPNPIDIFEATTTKRLIKTHLPYSFIRHQFEKVNPKMIVVMRNPKDNVVSCYPFFKGLDEIKKDVILDEFSREYMYGKALHGDYRELNLEWWSLRNRENVLILRYEDLVHQPFQQIRQIALFLGYSLSAEKIAVIAHNTRFDEMAKNKDVNTPLPVAPYRFLRKGKTGDWKNHLTVAQNEAMNEWIKEHLDSAGLFFTYE